MNTQQCYRVLGLDQGCSWHELRAAYRLQIKHWHPDKHQQQPDKHTLAEQKTQQINHAFRTLTDFRKQHGYLPISEPAESKQDAAAQPTTNVSAEKSHPAGTEELYQRQANTPRQSTFGRNALGLVVVIATAGFIYFSLLTPEEAKHSSQHAPRTTNNAKNNKLIQPSKETPYTARSSNEASHPTPHSKTAAANTPLTANKRSLGRNKSTLSDELSEKFFTYGDTLSKVIEVQGVPNHTVGDIWYYGTSEVHFSDGVVSAWHNTPSTPLRAH